MTNALISIIGSILGAIAAALITAYFNRRTSAQTTPSIAETSTDVRSKGTEVHRSMRWLLITLWPFACSAPEAALLSVGDDWFMVSIAIAQALLLRVVLGQEGRWAWWWFFASTSAWIVIWYDAWFTQLLPLDLMGPAYGILAGILQWLVLRGYYHYSAWWILVSFFAWTLGLAIGLQIDPGLGLRTAIGLFISGLITAFALAYIIKHPIREHSLQRD